MPAAGTINLADENSPTGGVVVVILELELLLARTSETLDSAADPIAGDEIDEAIVVQILGCDPHAATVVGVAREEVEQRALDGGRDALAEQDLTRKDQHAWPAAGSGPDDQIVESIAVHVASRDERAVSQRGFEHEEVVQQASELTGRQPRTIEDRDARPTTEPGGHDQVDTPISVDVAETGPGPAPETRILDTEEAQDLLKVAALEDDDPWTAAFIRSYDDVPDPVQVDVPQGDERAARE